MSNIFSGKSAEHLLVSHLTRLGYEVSIPVVDGVYDMLVDNGKTLKKVQVKSTQTPAVRTKGGYQCVIMRSGSTKTPRKKYEKSDIDIFAVYVEPRDTWFFIPTGLINVKTIVLYPNQKKGKFDIYENYFKIFEL